MKQHLPDLAQANTDPVRSMLADAWKVTVGTGGNRVAVLDPATLEVRSVTRCGNESSLDCLAFVGPYLVTGSFDRTLNLWET
jgi:hypothetical protein